MNLSEHDWVQICKTEASGWKDYEALSASPEHLPDEGLQFGRVVKVSAGDGFPRRAGVQELLQENFLHLRREGQQVQGAQ